MPRPKMVKPQTQDKLFTQVIKAASMKISHLWEEGDKYITKKGLNCTKEIEFDKSVGRSYYQCNPHFWQCFWSGGVIDNPSLEIDLFGQTFHVKARPAFSAIPSYSNDSRYIEFVKPQEPGLHISYGHQVELEVAGIAGKKQTLILNDTCRDTYLPQRIYGHGKGQGIRDLEFVWDNFDRNIFIDKFYVTNRQVNEWRIFQGNENKIVKDPKNWPKPAILRRQEQVEYCRFVGKRLLEAKLFDAASMPPSDFKNPQTTSIYRPATPWMRDLSKSFLGVARINPDYQLTPLDCQLAQVQGCPEKYFTTDSASWNGVHYLLGFYPESMNNFYDPPKNIKMSSRFQSPASHWHELGLYSEWNGEQEVKLPVAFRCYEEVGP